MEEDRFNLDKAESESEGVNGYSKDLEEIINLDTPFNTLKKEDSIQLKVYINGNLECYNMKSSIYKVDEDNEFFYLSTEKEIEDNIFNNETQTVKVTLSSGEEIYGFLGKTQDNEVYFYIDSNFNLTNSMSERTSSRTIVLNDIYAPFYEKNTIFSRFDGNFKINENLDIISKLELDNIDLDSYLYDISDDGISFIIRKNDDNCFLISGGDTSFNSIYFGEKKIDIGDNISGKIFLPLGEKNVDFTVKIIQEKGDIVKIGVKLTLNYEISKFIKENIDYIKVYLVHYLKNKTKKNDL